MAEEGQQRLGTSSGAATRAPRRARALVGWMESEAAQQALLGYRADMSAPADVVQRVSAAQAAVRSRGSQLDQRVIVQAPPPQLARHLAVLAEHAGAAPYYKEGWQPKLVDLRHVIAFQPRVFIDNASERLPAAASASLEQIAELTLPIRDDALELRPTYDSRQQIWSVVSPNPNLRITGNLAGNVPGIPPGSFSLGFIAAVLPSYVQVARFQDRYILRDGYHRAVLLLMAGVHHAPAFVNEIQRFEQLVPPGMLPQHAFLGDHPPTLQDYLDDTVSAEIAAPATQKLVMVQAIEMNI